MYSYRPIVTKVCFALGLISDLMLCLISVFLPFFC